MKLAQEKSFSIVNGDMRSSTFGIKSSAKAFKIISSGIYSDKISAVIRELSTNAYDSHVANGNETEPFEVKLPNSMSPTFVVRDFGTGLTIEELGLVDGVPGVYNTYFESNKTDSNDFTGCLGLGSKSPFSYSSNFLVESFKDGTHYICSAHLNEFGEPTITLMSEAPTTERNGVKVTVSVENNDCDDFVEKAQIIYRYFKVCPKVTGAIFEIEKDEIITEGTGWKLLQSYGEAVAVMGNVHYPITTNSTEFTQDEKNFLACSFEVAFPVGELEFDAGRESLGYDKRTIAVLKRKVAEIRSEISDRFKDIYGDCKNLWEARKKYCYVKYELSKISSLITLPDTYNGIKLFDGYSSELRIQIPGVDVSCYNIRQYARKFNKYTSANIDVRKNIIFYENDIKIGASSRAEHYLNTNRIGSNESAETMCVVTFANDVAKSAFFTFVGIDSTVMKKISDLPKKPSNGRTGSSAQSLQKICKYKNGYNNSSSSFTCWENVTHDINAGGNYVELNRGKMRINGKIFHARELSSVINKLAILGSQVEFFGVKTVIVKKVEAMSQWKDLSGMIKEIFNAHPEYETMYESYQNLKQISWRTKENIEKIVKMKPNNSPAIKELQDKFGGITAQVKDISETAEAFRLLWRFAYNSEYSSKNDENTLEKLYNDVIVKYPLLHYVSDGNLKDFTNYVNLCDKENV